jgi:hypothetical protein
LRSFVVVRCAEQFFAVGDGCGDLGSPAVDAVVDRAEQVADLGGLTTEELG